MDARGRSAESVKAMMGINRTIELQEEPLPRAICHQSYHLVPPPMSFSCSHGAVYRNGGDEEGGRTARAAPMADSILAILGVSREVDQPEEPRCDSPVEVVYERDPLAWKLDRSLPSVVTWSMGMVAHARTDLGYGRGANKGEEEDAVEGPIGLPLDESNVGFQMLVRVWGASPRPV